MAVDQVIDYRAVGSSARPRLLHHADCPHQLVGTTQFRQATQEEFDTLAHCYGVLAGLLSEAHERMGVRMQTFGGRTAYWHLGERSLMHHVTKAVERNGSDVSDRL
jgi:hypothetical protein